MEPETEEAKNKVALVGRCCDACGGLLNLLCLVFLAIVCIIAIFLFFGPLSAAIAASIMILLPPLLIVVYRYKQQHPESRKAALGFKLLAVISAVMVILVVIGGLLAADPTLIPSIQANPQAALFALGIVAAIVGPILCCVAILVIHSRKQAKKRELALVAEPKVPSHCSICEAPLRGDEKFCGSCGAAVEKK
jgi:hypothetical protein